MKDKLIKTLKEYIELLEKGLEEFSVFAFIHGIIAKDSDIQKGKELRKKIKKLKNFIFFLKTLQTLLCH